MNETKQPLRVAIIGTSARSDYLYGPILQALPHEVELVSIWGRSSDSARHLGESLGVPWYTDLARLTHETAPQIGIVSVAYQANAQVGLMAVEHGLHLLLETPIAHRLSEADAIIEDTLADIRNKTLTVNGSTEVVVFEDLAVYYALRGEAENAMFWSARAYAASPAGLEIRVLESALFDRVRDDPAFSSQIAAIRENLYSRVKRDSQEFR